MGAKFKFEKLSKQFGCYDGSKFGFYKKVTALKSAYSQVSVCQAASYGEHEFSDKALYYRSRLLFARNISNQVKSNSKLEYTCLLI